jgi:hypothetical protein
MVDRRIRDLVLYGGLYPFIVLVTAWFAGGDGAETGNLLILMAAVGFVGLLVVFSFVGGPGEVRSDWDETGADEPAPSAVRQAVFLGVTTLVSLLGALLL